MGEKYYQFNLGKLLDKSWEKIEADKAAKEFSEGELKVNPRVTEGSVKLKDGKIEGSCLRKIYIRLRKVTGRKGFDSYSLRRMRAGVDTENCDQENMQAAGILEANNVQFQYNNPLCVEQEIRGEIDSLIRIPSQEMLSIHGVESSGRPSKKEQYIVVEHKNAYGYSFETNVIGRKTTRGMPRIAYVLQLAQYVHQFPKAIMCRKHWQMLRPTEDGRIPHCDKCALETNCLNCEYFSEGIDVPYGKLYYTDRGDGKHKEFDIAVVGEKGLIYYCEHPCKENEQNFELEWKPLLDMSIYDVYDRYRQLHEYIKDEQIPPMDYDPLFSSAKIEEKYAAKEVTKGKYEAWCKNPNVPIGDIECEYCDFRNYCIEDMYSSKKKKTTNKTTPVKKETTQVSQVRNRRRIN